LFLPYKLVSNGDCAYSCKPVPVTTTISKGAKTFFIPEYLYENKKLQ
jgi:hypothetical protein